MMAGRVGNAFLPTKIYPKGINRKTTQARQGLGGLAMIRQVNGGRKVLPTLGATPLIHNNLTKAATALTAITINVPNLIVMRCSS